MSTNGIPKQGVKSKDWFDELPERLDAAVEAYGFADSSDFQPLADLSAATRFDGIDVDAESVVVRGKQWSAPGTVYVTLVYDPNNEPVEIDDTYPITIFFSVSPNKEITIQNIEADVRSFYE